MALQSTTKRSKNAHSSRAKLVADDSAASGPHLEAEILAVGAALDQSIRGVLAAIQPAAAGPVALAQTLGLDKVLASRILKALRQQDPIAVLYFMPGPEPLRAFLKSADKRGLPDRLHQAAQSAISDYQRLIDVHVGDRSLLDSILSAWIPEARAEFELRRKQSAFKALSQLKGAQAKTITATCIVAPSADPTLMDIVWIHGLTGLHRVRPGVVVKLASRRMTTGPAARNAQTLAGEPISENALPLLPEFCSSPTPEIHVHNVSDALLYTLGGDGFGARSAVDVFFVEVNRAELNRVDVITDANREARRKRGAYFFAEASVPSAAMQFDLFMHQDMFVLQEPLLRIHDSAFEGVADVFDPRRDIDRLDMLETIQPLGRGLARARSGAVPNYHELLKRVMADLGFAPDTFRAYRAAIEYPLYGSQTSMVFPTPG